MKTLKYPILIFFAVLIVGCKEYDFNFSQTDSKIAFISDALKIVRNGA